MAIWGALVVVGSAVATALTLTGADISIEAPPFHALIDPVLTAELALALVVGVAMIVALPRIADRGPWLGVLGAAVAGSAVFGVALASIRGLDRVVAPVRGRREYLAVLPDVGAVGPFLESFTTRLASYPVHVQGHPPGTVLLATALRGVGLGGPVAFAGLLIGGGLLLAPATLVAVREVAGERWARAAMPFLVVGPAAVWLVTSADALFAGVAAVGVALVVMATGRRGRRSDALALVGGVTLGLAAFLSYGLVLLSLIPLVVAWRRGAIRAIALAALGGVAVALLFRSGGFWWFDGLAATRDQYFAGIAARRSYVAFLLIDLAAFALVLGPATAVGLSRLRDRRMWLIVGSGFAAVAVALLSGMAKGEVERIWLPFAPWLLVATAAVAVPTSPVGASGPVMRPRGERRAVMRWLGVQVGAAILIECLIRTPW